jgi:hypothetical protein
MTIMPSQSWNRICVGSDCSKTCSMRFGMGRGRNIEPCASSDRVPATRGACRVGVAGCRVHGNAASLDERSLSAFRPGPHPTRPRRGARGMSWGWPSGDPVAS